MSSDDNDYYNDPLGKGDETCFATIEVDDGEDELTADFDADTSVPLFHDTESFSKHSNNSAPRDTGSDAPLTPHENIFAPPKRNTQYSLEKKYAKKPSAMDKLSRTPTVEVDAEAYPKDEDMPSRTLEEPAYYVSHPSIEISASKDFTTHGESTRRSSCAMPSGTFAADSKNQISKLERELEDAIEEKERASEVHQQAVKNLRQEVEKLMSENNKLHAKSSKLESEVRSLTLEKESVEWSLQKEKSQRVALEERLAALQADFESYTTAREKALPEEPTRRAHHRHVDPAPVLMAPSTEEDMYEDRPYAAPPNRNSYRDEAVASAPMPQSRQYERRPLRPRGSADTMPYDDHHSRVHESGNVSWSAAPQAAPASPSDPATAARAVAIMTEKEKDQTYKSHLAEVESLEAQLLQHSLARDELTSRLQRLESTRLRSVSERAKKTAVENELESEQKIIGHIRLKLRSITQNSQR